MPTPTITPAITKITELVGPDTSMLRPDTLEILIRLVAAMLIGALIGTEREYTHRPAGMRTHMLVSLGSAAVMITSQMLFAQYRPYGATPDPARLSAQVITGVGFLGAGTILKEGPTVKGLTTAASLWATACLGIAVGAGYYAVSLIGAVCMLVTLVLFEKFQNQLMQKSHARFLYTVTCDDVAHVLEVVNRLAKEHDAGITVSGVTTDKEGLRHLNFKIQFNGRGAADHAQRFLIALSADATVSRVDEEQAHAHTAEKQKGRARSNEV